MLEDKDFLRFCTDERDFDGNETLLAMLNQDYPSFIPSVPNHWLCQKRPTLKVRLCISIVFSCLAIPGNISQTLVTIVFLR